MSGFLQRLKERKLVQWAIAYVAAGFALLQGIDIVAQRFGWPESIERALIVALATEMGSESFSGGRAAARGNAHRLENDSDPISPRSPSGHAVREVPEFKTFITKTGLTALRDRYGAPDACRRIALGDYDCRSEVTQKP